MSIKTQRTLFTKQTYKLYILSLIVVPLFLSLFSCNSDKKTLKQFQKPEYIDIAMDRISTLRNSNNNAAGLRYIDSIKAKYFHVNAASKYHIYYLYYDFYNRTGEQKTAVNYIDSMRSILEDVNNVDLTYKELISVNYFKADILFQEKRFDDAYLYYYNALSLSQKYNDSCDQYYYYLVLANVMYKNEQYADALKYYISTSNLLADCTTLFWTYYRRQQAYNNIGLCFEHIGQYDSSIKYYTSALKHINTGYSKFPEEKHHLINVAKAVVEGNLGSVYMKAGRYAEAEPLLIRSIDTNGKKGFDGVDAQFNRIKLASIYLKTGREKEAKSILDKVRVIGDSINNRVVEKRWNKAMWLYWESQNDNSKAFENLSTYQKISDSLRIEQAEFSVADIDARVNNIANEYQIKTLKENADTRKIYLVIALVVSILALIIAFLVAQILRRSRRHVRMLKTMNERINDQKKQLRNTYNELEKLDNEKDRILKAVSHDMRSPINSAIALVNLLVDSSENLTEEQKEYLQLIQNSCDNALTITKDLLEIATLNTSLLEKEAVNVNSFITTSVELIKYRAAQKQQKIILSTPNNVVTAYMNQEKMRRVANNLITNAIKFSPSGADILVMVTEANSKMKIEVKDTGIGIPVDIRDKVFDLFTEAKRFGTSGEQPYGLGLSICKQIVESHNGEIWFETEEGKGTSFYISIPLN